MKTTSTMKLIMLCTLYLILTTQYSTAQTGLRINGTKFIITSGAIVWVDGGQNGDFTATNANSTEAKVDLDGTLKIDGDWVNNNTSEDLLINQDTDGSIELAGSSLQQLSGSATNDFSFEKLKINTGSLLVLGHDQSLTLNGDLTLNGHFRINSNPLGTGSFLDNGTISQSVPALVGRYVNNTDKNHLVSPSVSNATGAQLVHANKGNYNVYQYDPPSWVRVFPNTPLVPGKGYSIVYNDTNTIFFKGKLNYGNISLDISDSNLDWNLIGNPYPSALDALDFLNANAAGTSPSIYGTMYFWDESSVYDENDYASWNGIGAARGNSGGTAPTQYIGSGQAFFVQSKAKTNNSINFNNAMREISNTQFFLLEPQQIPRIKLSATSESGAFNEILIGFLEEATQGVDNLYDGHKLQGNPELSFYSFIPGMEEKYVIQGLPLPSQNTSIPLGLEITKDGEYVFKKELLENFSPSTEIYFYDKLLDKEYDLNLVEEISYYLNAGSIDDRFELRFFPATNSLEKESEYSFEPNVYIVGKTIVVKNDTPFSGTLGIYDMLGKELMIKSIKNSNFESIQQDVAKGIYILILRSNDYRLTKRIFIE